ncbi:hypothetical protein ANN_02955 [Periplaneta americana]|uniref:Uncharacterized protein n=1 Tax=Periplaneta americana TaxID=6978 RepID=A0ABQ8TZC7_PERAM|nr:hypothetical protein ANN_02955 [Periplaneta americana]
MAGLCEGGNEPPDSLKASNNLMNRKAARQRVAFARCDWAPELSRKTHHKTNSRPADMTHGVLSLALALALALLLPAKCDEGWSGHCESWDWFTDQSEGDLLTHNNYLRFQRHKVERLRYPSSSKPLSEVQLGRSFCAGVLGYLEQQSEFIETRDLPPRLGSAACSDIIMRSWFQDVR